MDIAGHPERDLREYRAIDDRYWISPDFLIA